MDFPRGQVAFRGIVPSLEAGWRAFSDPLVQRRHGLSRVPGRKGESWAIGNARTARLGAQRGRGERG